MPFRGVLLWVSTTLNYFVNQFKNHLSQHSKERATVLHASHGRSHFSRHELIRIHVPSRGRNWGGGTGNWKKNPTKPSYPKKFLVGWQQVFRNSNIISQWLSLQPFLPSEPRITTLCVPNQNEPLSYKFRLCHLFFPVPHTTEMVISFIQSEQGWLKTKLLLLNWGLL